MSRKSERKARERAAEILQRASARGEDIGGDYGAGRLTRAQKKSQKDHIPWTPGPETTGQKVWRNLFG